MTGRPKGNRQPHISYSKISLVRDRPSCTVDAPYFLKQVQTTKRLTIKVQNFLDKRKGFLGIMLVILALAAVGALAVAIIVIDSLWSVLELVTSYLMPYFLPAEVLPLSKRFGPWAGELTSLVYWLRLFYGWPGRSPLSFDLKYWHKIYVTSVNVLLCN